MKRNTITKGSGNVFQDLGLGSPKEEFARANLTAQISSIIEKRGLTQNEAASILGIDQPKVSALKNGKYTGFSIERLFSFIMALGSDIEVIIKPTKTVRYKHKEANITIYAAY